MSTWTDSARYARTNLYEVNPTLAQATTRRTNPLAQALREVGGRTIGVRAT